MTMIITTGIRVIPLVNYWDDYTGSDSNNDGIGDTPYPVPGGTSQDNYPLMHPYCLISELSDGWNFISLPVNLSSEKTNTLISHNEYFYNWSDAMSNNLLLPFIFGWNRAAQSYQFDDTLIPGYGYWVYAYDDCELWTFNYERNFDDYITDVKSGWTVIGSSCDYPLEKESIIVNHNGTDYNWTDAVTAGIINDYVFGWDRSGQSYNFADTFIPGYAYWLYAYQECTLKREV